MNRRHLILAIGLALLGAGEARAEAGADLSAALIYNIIRFVEFPDTSSTLRLCVRQGDQLANALRQLNGRPAGRLQVRVVTTEGMEGLHGSCDVVVIGGTPAYSFGRPAAGQMLIGDTENFVESGGTVGLIRFGRQTRFAINATAVQRSKLRVSSQVMQLAAKVIR
ncbi:MAG: YfiR family protein [Sphingomonadales bacterium]|nr:YfiR family protein [Sphingomonadales bacterium]